MTLRSLSARWLVARRTADTMEALESRVLLANTVVFTDDNGDQVTVKLTGAGTVTPVLSSGATGFISQMQFAGTDATSALSISVKKLAGDGRVLALDMDDATLKSLVAPTTDLGTNFEAAFGAISRVTVGQIPLGAEVDFVTPPGKNLAVVCEVISGKIDVVGGISSFRAANVTSAARVTASGVIASVRSNSSAQGNWLAENYGSITALGELGGDWRARGPNASGYSFGAIKGAVINDLRLDADVTNIFGRIRSLTVAGSVIDAEIIARGLDTLKVGGDLNAELNLTEDDPALFAMKSVTVGGEVDGEWDISTRLGTLKFGDSDSGFDLDGSGTHTHIRSITFTGTGVSSGDYGFASLGSLKSAGRVGGEWKIEGTIPGSPLGVKSMNVLRFQGATFEVLTSGMGPISTQAMDGCNFTTEFLTTISVRKGSNADGNFLATNLRATSPGGDGSAGKFSLRSLSVAGLSDDSTVMVRSNLGTLTFGTFLDTVVFAGAADPLAQAPDFGDTLLLDATSSIKSFRVTKAFVSGDFAVGVVPRVTAGFIERIFINGDTSRNDGSSGGFVAASFGTIRMRSTTGTLFTFVPAGLGDNNPFAPTASDFVFRIVAV